MTISEDLAQIGAELEAFHAKTQTSLDFGMYFSDGSVKYFMWIATQENLKHEFSTAQVLLDWLKDVNASIDPHGSAMIRKQAETLKAQQIIRDAELAALEKQIGDLPATQVIIDAEKAASLIIQEAEAKLSVIDEAKVALEKEAAAKQAELDAAVAKLSPEEIAKIEAIIKEREAAADTKG